MAQISFKVDTKIKVIFPFMTKGLKGKERSRINTTGAFKFEPRPQVDTSQGAQSRLNVREPASDRERAKKLGENLGNLLEEIARIKKVFRKRSQNIILEYDPGLTENEPLTDAEETLFGNASGTVTYEMFEQVLDFEAKLNKWLGHQSIANGGQLSANT